MHMRQGVRAFLHAEGHRCRQACLVLIICTSLLSLQVGEGSQLGHCRHACKACEVCGSGDTACRGRNRVAAGFLPLDD
jgi:hypothetical protein